MTAAALPGSLAAGSVRLSRLAARRDRWAVPVWAAVLAAVAGVSAAATAALYPDAADRAGAAGAIDAAPALRAVYGPIADTADPAALALWKLGVLGAVATALLAGSTVIRHSRAEEDAGRLDLLAAGRVGRLAPALAALAAGLAAALLVTLATGVVLAGVGVPVAGAAAFAAVWGAAGVVFAGVALVAAQLARSARTARALLVGTLLAAYLLRAAADGGLAPSWLVWASPLGWGERVDAFGATRWRVLLLAVAAGWLLTAVALELQVRRDAGAGVLPERTGPARASRGLRGAFGLAWRRQRAGLLGWSAGFVLLGALCGGVTVNLGGLLDSPRMRAVVETLGGAGALGDAFLAAELGLLAGLVALTVVAAVLRMSGEERSGRLDMLLATPLPRIRWAAAHVAVAVLGGVVLLGLTGAAAGLARGLGVAGVVAAATTTALAQAPAVVVAAGTAVLLHGLSAALAPLAWALVGGTILLAELGPLLDVPRWALDLSPFTHLPHLPGGAVDAAAWAGVLGVGVVLVAAGLVALRRRDLG